MNTQTLTTKEKLRAISAKIGQYQIRYQRARLSGDYQEFKTMRGAIELAQKEFSRLSKIYRKEKSI